MERNTQLTPHFNLNEFIRDQDPIPGPDVLANIENLANRLQVVREFLNKKITITSGYRTAKHNAAVGGSNKSYHLWGMAADIQVAGMTPAAVNHFLKSWSGGLGVYPNHTHVDIRPNKTRWTGKY